MDARPALVDSRATLIASGWADHALEDSGGGRKLERLGPFRIVRPEAQCLWRPRLADADWAGADAVFEGGEEEEGGRWRFARPLPETWPLRWRQARFCGRFTAFRHLGVFPEQAANWTWIDEGLRRWTGEPPRLLNLFGYTGVASLVAALAGARVTHVDASKKAVGWARENAALSGLAAAPIRWICEDARKWVAREVRRGATYEAIILDPPKYGRGPAGETWRLHDDLAELIAGCAALLSGRAAFLLLNAYSERFSALAMASLLADALARSRRRHRLGRAGAGGGGRRARGGPLQLRPLERLVVSAPRRVTSLANATVKAAAALRLRKAREESGQFLAEGLQAVAEAIDLGWRPRTLLFGGGMADHVLVKRAAAVAGEALEVTDAILAKVSRRDNPQTVLGVFDQRWGELARLDPLAAPCWIALEEVRDPGNLGTIVRTADAAGCGGVILVGDCCDPFSIEAVRASMGSAFATPVFRADREAFAVWRAGWPGQVVGAQLTAATDFRALAYRRPTLLLMGPEQAGLSPALAHLCDASVKIPMRGRAESLNLAVATAILVYAIVAPTAAPAS